MSHHPRPEHDAPTPEQLAAHADGELGPADHARVEAWLRDHPDARAEVEAQRRLADVWRAGAPPEPADWSGVLARVEARLAAGPPAAPRRWPFLLGAVAGAAAAVVVGVVLTRPVTPRPGPALPVASPDDVEVLSIDAGDVGALVVGRPPVQGPLVLASADDVTVHDTGRDVNIVTPEAAPPNQPARPMIMVPADPGRAP
jgi:anti-sigma factor RsiW